MSESIKTYNDKYYCTICGNHKDNHIDEHMVVNGEDKAMRTKTEEKAFDDITIDEHGRWTQVCKKHGKQYKSLGIYLDDHGSGACGVIGCWKESDHYLQLEDFNHGN